MVNHALVIQHTKIFVLCEVDIPSPTPDETKPAPDLHRVHLNKVEISPVEAKNAPKYDDEVMENEHDYVEVKPKHVAHQMNDAIDAEQVSNFH